MRDLADRKIRTDVYNLSKQSKNHGKSCSNTRNNKKLRAFGRYLLCFSSFNKNFVFFCCGWFRYIFSDFFFVECFVAVAASSLWISFETKQQNDENTTKSCYVIQTIKWAQASKDARERFHLDLYCTTLVNTMEFKWTSRWNEKKMRGEKKLQKQNHKNWQNPFEWKRVK